MSTRTPAKHFSPLAIGAPEPYRQLPVRLERMVHFVPPHNEKIRARLGELIPQVDVVLGNLEDAIPADAKTAARAGFIAMANAHDFGQTGLWTRINALNSPWGLDDILEIVAAAGAKLDVIMLPKVEGPWDIHYLDQLLAQLEAKHALRKPILIHAILETAEGVKNVGAIAAASPRMHGMSLGPADLAASRGMKTTRVGGGHPAYGILADPGAPGVPRALFQQDLWHYTLARMVDAWTLHPSQIDIAKRVFSLDANEVAFAKRIIEAMPDGTGAAMIDGKMQDDATWKQAQVILDLATLVASRDPERKALYGL
jgi:malyl-CoA/(S)-citramalyl-CoA lyase